MTPRYALVWLLLVGACGAASPHTTEPDHVATTTATPPCAPLPADAGTPKAGFALGDSYLEVHVYKIGPGGCGTLVATFDAEGPFAFGFIGEPGRDGMPDLTIDTWLMHGDRRRQTFSWSGRDYGPIGRGEDILGPRR